MSIELNGTTGITTPDLTSTDDITANSSAVLTSASLPTALNATGSAPIYAARAWVNFNGTGTVAIRAAGNVSSITDNGSGDYTINFTNALPDENYCPVCEINQYNASTVNYTVGPRTGTLGGAATTMTTTALRILGQVSNGDNHDAAGFYVTIFR